MGHRHFCKRKSPSDIQETLMVHYVVHNSPSLFPIFSQMTDVQVQTTYLRSNLILSSTILLGVPSCLFPLSCGKYKVIFNMMTHEINTY